MSLKRITIPTAGGTSVTEPKLAFSTLIAAHRSGGQHYFTDGDPGSGDVKFDPAMGKLWVDAAFPFDPGETVFVIYKAGEPGEVIITPPVEPPPPTVCDAPGAVSVVVNNDKTVTVTMPGMGYFAIRITAVPDSCDGTQVAGGSTGGNDSWTSPPLPNGDYKACVLRQCPPSLLSAWSTSSPFQIATVVPPAPNNCGARKDPPDTQVKILSMTGFPYAIRSGAFPLDVAGEEMRGRHEGFSGVISVEVSVRGNQKVVVALYRSGPLIQYKVAFRPTNGNVTVSFSSITALPSDDVFVVLGYN